MTINDFTCINKIPCTSQAFKNQGTYSLYLYFEKIEAFYKADPFFNALELATLQKQIPFAKLVWAAEKN